MKISTEIYTSKVTESTEFYVKHFGFEVKLEQEDFTVIDPNGILINIVTYRRS